MRESAKPPKEEHHAIAETRKQLRYPEFPEDTKLVDGVWDRKGKEPVDR